MRYSRNTALLAVTLLLAGQLPFSSQSAEAAEAVGTADSFNWLVAERSVPPPAGASADLRTAIATTPPPDVAASSTYPQSVEAWQAFIEAADRGQTLPLTAVEQVGVSIVREEIAGVSVYRITPNEIADQHSDHLFVYLHGGAYVFGKGDASVPEAALIAATAGIPALAIDYRMPPAHPFPAAVDDAVAVYRELLASYEPSAIAMGGTSAGSGLALATVHQLLAMQLPVPSAIYAGTPWADLTKTGDTLFTNEGIDRILVTYEGLLKGAALLYANGHDLTDPLLSPIYGDFAGFPPTFLVSGTRDLFLSDTVRTHRKLRAAGVDADLHVYEAISHAEYAFVRSAPESDDMYAELAAFLAQHL